MNSKLIFATAILLVAYPYILTRGSAAADANAAGLPNSAQGTAIFSAEELDNLLAPIALYPDPLLAQIFPAATFADQITEAATWVRAGNNPAQVTNQPWDTSVKALAGFPDVLYKMSDNMDWTTALGQAIVAQSNDVSASIQRLRQQARNSGALTTTPQQTVAVDQGNVTIMPAQPTQVYVPQYDPGAVYGGSTAAAVAGGLLSFGTGIALGGWWNNGWNRGWNWGGGGIYNLNRNNLALNRNVLNRNINGANLNRINSVHPNTDWGRHARTAPGNLPGRTGTPGRFGAPGAGIGNRSNLTGTPRSATGMGANRSNIPRNSPGMRSSTPGARPAPQANRPSGQRGGGKAAGGGARRGGGGRKH